VSSTWCSEQNTTRCTKDFPYNTFSCREPVGGECKNFQCRTKVWPQNGKHIFSHLTQLLAAPHMILSMMTLRIGTPQFLNLLLASPTSSGTPLPRMHSFTRKYCLHFFNTHFRGANVTHTFVVLPHVYGYFNIPSATLKYRDSPNGHVEVFMPFTSTLSLHFFPNMSLQLRIAHPFYCRLFFLPLLDSF
jgi:hypothetical protein